MKPQGCKPAGLSWEVLETIRGKIGTIGGFNIHVHEGALEDLDEYSASGWGFSTPMRAMLNTPRIRHCERRAACVP